MKGLSFLLGFIYAALIALLFLTVKNCDKPVRDFDDDDDEEEVIDEEETDEDDLEITENYGQGDLQITLLWDFAGDVDLHVTEPGGFELGWIIPEGTDGHLEKNSPNGGRLDHDEQEGGGGSAENIYWENPPKGNYKVEVVYYNDRDAGPDEGIVRVVVKKAGAEPKTHKVRVHAPERDDNGQIDIYHLDRVKVTTVKVR